MKTRGFAPQTPEIDENDKNGGCHLGKMTVYQKHRLATAIDVPPWSLLSSMYSTILNYFFLEHLGILKELWLTFPVGQKRHPDVASEVLPGDKFCLLIVSQLSLSRVHFSERHKSPLRGERQFGRHFKRQFGRGQLRVKKCRETVGSQILPRDI